MKKQIILRSLIGAVFGIAICTFISIINSVIVNDGNIYMIVPALSLHFNTDLSAYIFQTIMVMIYGTIWGGSSIIWDKHNWSLLKQSLIHLVICSVSTFPVAYILHWMEHSVIGVLIYYAIFFLIYFFVWLSTYCSIRAKVKKINAKMNNLSL